MGFVVSRRPLQIATGLLGVIPVVTGALTMLGLADPIYSAAGLPAYALLDSNLRFLGGLWLVVGLALFWLIPRIERETTLFRAVWPMVFAGGVGRLLSIAFVGAPPWPFIGFMLLAIAGMKRPNLTMKETPHGRYPGICASGFCKPAFQPVHRR
jgi:hypothetical protein